MNIFCWSLERMFDVHSVMPHRVGSVLFVNEITSQELCSLLNMTLENNNTQSEKKKLSSWF